MDQTENVCQEQEQEWREIIPCGRRVLIKKLKDKEKTSGGILLPDQAKLPNIHAYVLEIGAGIDQYEYPIKRYDKILVNPCDCIPVDFEDVITKGDESNNMFVIPIEDVIAIIRTNKTK